MEVGKKKKKKKKKAGCSDSTFISIKNIKLLLAAS